jgi:hypothetical protein
MSDGNILRNTGSGWKLYKKLKPGVDSAAYAARMRAQYDARDPLFHEYIKLLCDMAPLSERWKVAEAARLMPNDPDGVWSTLNDAPYGGLDVDLDDCVRLCQLRQAAEALDASNSVTV